MEGYWRKTGGEVEEKRLTSTWNRPMETGATNDAKKGHANLYGQITSTPQIQINRLKSRSEYKKP